MERIAQLIKKIQDVYYKPGTAEVIDLDLMLDYTRVLYADLLEQRTQKLAAQGMGLHLNNTGNAHDQVEAKNAGRLETGAAHLNASSLPSSGEEDEEIILNLGASSPMYFSAGSTSIEEELDARQLAAQEENVPRLDFNLIDNRNKSKTATPKAKNAQQSKVEVSVEQEPEPEAKIELEPEIVLEPAPEPEVEFAPEPEIIPEPIVEIAPKPELVSEVEAVLPEPEHIVATREVEPEQILVSSLDANDLIFDEIPLEIKTEETIQMPAPQVRNKDIRSFIGINDKYQFMNELFANNKSAYEETLDTIAQKSDAHSAELWLVEEHAIKNNWKLEDETFLELLTTVKRYFSAV